MLPNAVVPLPFLFFLKNICVTQKLPIALGNLKVTHYGKNY